jgi:hypothetical protein
MSRARAFVVLACLSCEEDSAYLYLGNQYEPSRDCLDSVSSLDVLAGLPPDGSCGPLCVVGTDQDAGIPVFVSTMCGPPPIGADISGSNPQCPSALAALSRGDYCLDGGGSTNPRDSSAE